MNQRPEKLRIPRNLLEQIDAGLEPHEMDSLEGWLEQSEEHRALFERALNANQTLDDQINAAANDVTLPQGVRERLMAAVESGSRWVAEQVDEVDAKGLAASGLVASGWPAPTDDAIAAQPLDESEKVVAAVQNEDVSPTTNRRRRTMIVAANVVAALLLVAVGFWIYVELQPQHEVSVRDLSRESVGWLASLNNGQLQPEVPDELADYPKCEQIRYEKLNIVGYMKISTEDFGDACGTVYDVIKEKSRFGPGRCYTMTVPVRRKQKFILKKSLPAEPLPCSQGKHSLAASLDIDGEYVHVFMVMNQKHYGELRLPDFTTTSFEIESASGQRRRIARSQIPEEVLRQFQQFVESN